MQHDVSVGPSGQKRSEGEKRTGRSEASLGALVSCLERLGL